MTSVDKAAIAWSIAIVAVGVGIAGAGMQGALPEIGVSTPSTTVPAMEPTKTTTKATIPGYDRLTSSQDPGIGHETHQLAIILAPSTNVYSGTLRYDASEPIQLVSLVGPLGPGEDKGQPIWTPDGKTKFALTFVDSKKSNGEWNFAGNALAVHTMKTTPFIVDYKITNLTEKPVSKTVMAGTVSSVIDPGVGHESHSLAVIIPPSEDVFSGTLAYSASENIQLVSLKGPLGPGETAPAIWTPDGKTNFALTFVDPSNQMGTWQFSGNALALHTMNTKGFTASYAVSSEKSSGVTVSAPKVTEPPKMTTPMTAKVSIPSGSSVPGCEETNACFKPAATSIQTGGTVTWSNDDTAAHTVTSGSPQSGPDGTFDSSLVMAGKTYEFTFQNAGSYDYFCMVHPWMTGKVQVG